MKNIRSILNLLIFAFIIVGTERCANPVSPAGGPKDTRPPGFLKAEPPQYTRNFDETRIRIYFDEFVELKDVNQQLIVSPPMEEMPEIKSRGRSIQVDFKEPLKDSTTYTLFFGNAIVDITENNPISNFLYVFSTGNILDSLTLKGLVTDAFTNAAVPDVSLMLYLDNNDTIPFDSLPYFVKPYFMTRTVANGEFTFNNLPDKSFKIFALEDQNATLTFDQPTERIAFIDSLVEPYYVPPVVKDTAELKNDSLSADTLNPAPIQTDTLKVDSIPQDTMFNPLRTRQLLNMYLFQETDSNQRFIKASLLKPQNIAFIFKNPVIAPDILVIDTVIKDSWYIREDGVAGDTILYWMTEIPSDSLTFVIEDNGEILDTTRIALKATEKKRRGRKDKEDEEAKKESLKPDFMKGSPIPGKPFVVRFPYPIKTYNERDIMMIEGEDTLFTRFEFTDSIRRKAVINRDWEESTRYKFIIPDSVFTDIRGLSHDTLTPSFTTKALADYGNFYVDITIGKPGANFILQLLEGDKKHREIQITEEGRVAFEYLLPASYQLKVIYDTNHNGKWDTGDYHYKIQPEAVNFFPKEITVRANWDIVEEWEL